MEINKLIFYTIFETIMLIALIISTYFLWGTFDNTPKDIAYAYTNPKANLSLDLENNLKPLIPIKDEEAINKNNQISLKLNNNGKTQKQYCIYLKINENTNLDIKYLKISIKEEPRYLYTLENFEYNNERYYIISKGLIDSNIEKTQNLYIWLSEETPNVEQNKELKFTISVEEM